MGRPVGGCFPQGIYRRLKSVKISSGVPETRLFDVPETRFFEKTWFLNRRVGLFYSQITGKNMVISTKPINPYVIGRPIYKPELFFGRESLFQFVGDNLFQGSQVILLHGQRRIGKSSVIAQIPNFVMPDKFAFVLFDLQDKNALSVGAVLHRLAKEIRDNLQLSPEKIELPSVAALENKKEIFSESFLPQVTRELEGRNLVLLLDEFDVLSNYNPNSAEEHFFPYLQSLIVGHPQLFIVPVVGRRVEDMPKLLSLFRRAPQWEIGLLDDRSARQLIVKPAEGVLEYEEEAIAAIIELTAGHPYFTQVICFALFGEARQEDRWRVSRTDVEKVADKAIEIAEGGLQWFRDGLPVAERVVFSAVAEAQQIAAANGDGVGREPLALLKEYGVVETEALIEAGGRLVDWGFLDLVDVRERFPRYKFIVELVRRWLVKRYPVRDEIWELEKVSSEANRIYELAGEFAQNKVFLKNALNLYEQVLEINPNHFKTLFNLGEGYLKVKDFKKGAEVYQRLYKVNPLRAEDGLEKSTLGYGSQLIERGETELAREQFRQTFKGELIKYKKGPTEVGDNKSLTTQATLYKNGLLLAETDSRCKNLFHYLIGRVLIVGHDAEGKAIWVTKTYKCKTCGRLLDPTTKSEKFDVWVESVQSEAVAITRSINIFHSDRESSFKLEKVIATMKATFGGVQEINNIYYGYQFSQFGIGHTIGGQIKDNAKVAGVFNEQKNLAETLTEVQEILQQLSQTYPTNTISEKVVIAAEASKQVEANPILKKRLINVAKEGGLAEIEKGFDNPIGAVFVGAIKGWQENDG